MTRTSVLSVMSAVVVSTLALGSAADAGPHVVVPTISVRPTPVLQAHWLVDPPPGARYAYLNGAIRQAPRVPLKLRDDPVPSPWFAHR
jgi:hypothetical protein